MPSGGCTDRSQLLTVIQSSSVVHEAVTGCLQPLIYPCKDKLSCRHGREVLLSHDAVLTDQVIFCLLRQGLWIPSISHGGHGFWKQSRKIRGNDFPTKQCSLLLHWQVLERSVVHSASEELLAQPSRIFPPLASTFGCQKGELRMTSFWKGI